MISFYKSVYEKSPSGEISISSFLSKIKDGYWQDKVLEYRLNPIKEVKDKLPNVMISGTFEAATDKSLKIHSGFICIDIDDVDIAYKDTLSGDKYVHAVFTSVSGKGLAVVFEIDSKLHYESFDGIAQYLFNEYKLQIDPSGRNLARRRFVSFDPYAYINEGKTKRFDKIIRPEKKITSVVYSKTDFDEILKRIESKLIDITGDYDQWLRVCFGIVDKFGENGREYFHSISQYSEKYSHSNADKQYDNCLKSKGSKRATIATVYYYAKQSGISTVSEKTMIQARQASIYKKSGLNKEIALENAKKFDLNPDLEIYDQIFDEDVIVDTNVDIISGVTTYLQSNYSIKFNKITRRMELDGKLLTNIDLNTIFLESKKSFEKLSYELFERILFSNSTDQYNPIHNYFAENIHRKNNGLIDKLFNCIISDTGDSGYLAYFGKKWLVGIIASCYEKHNPLMLVLSGNKQGTGKTEFFRRLLPEKLKRWYAENKLDAEKDGEILMTQKLIIMDDELGGKNKKENTRIKEILSKQVFTLREPYGRYNEDLTRLASLCGTSNEKEILQDPTGNRRLIIFNVKDIDKLNYNTIDKDDLIMEAFHLYNEGFNCNLSTEDVSRLNQNSLQFESVDPTEEYINAMFSKDGSGYPIYLTTSEIIDQINKNYRINNNMSLNTKRTGMVLQKLGFKQEIKYSNGSTKRTYKVYRIDNGVKNVNEDLSLPF